MRYFFGLSKNNYDSSYKERHEIAEGAAAKDKHQKSNIAPLSDYYFFVLQKGKKRKERKNRKEY